MEVFGEHCLPRNRTITSHQDQDLAGPEAGPELHVEPGPARLLLGVPLKVLLEHPEHLADIDERGVERCVAVGESDGEDEQFRGGESEKSAKQGSANAHGGGQAGHAQRNSVVHARIRVTGAVRASAQSAEQEIKAYAHDAGHG